MPLWGRGTHIRSGAAATALGSVAHPAQHLQGAVRGSSCSDGFGVVGGEVCRWVWWPLPSGAPVAVCPAMLSYGPCSALALGPCACALGGCGAVEVAVTLGLMLGAPGVGGDGGAAGC